MNMLGYIGSAKTGDKIYQMFFKLAADLAGVQISKAQMEAQQSYWAQQIPKEKISKQ